MARDESWRFRRVLSVAIECLSELIFLPSRLDAEKHDESNELRNDTPRAGSGGHSGHENNLTAKYMG